LVISFYLQLTTEKYCFVESELIKGKIPVFLIF